MYVAVYVAMYVAVYLSIINYVHTKHFKPGVRWPQYAWFLEIDFVHHVCVLVWACACVCTCLSSANCWHCHLAMAYAIIEPFILQAWVSLHTVLKPTNLKFRQ